MKREAFKMYLKPGYEAEYERRHNEIWPEVKELLKERGVSDYSIFWDKETNLLFGVQKTEGNASSQDLGDNAIIQKWWAYMANIMEPTPTILRSPYRSRKFSTWTKGIKKIFSSAK